MKLIVHGATGRMGQLLCQLAEQQGHTVAARVAVDAPETPGYYRSLADCSAAADCVVDFSNHAATAELLAFCTAGKLPVVIATTGQTEAEKAAITASAEDIPVFFSANMSIGVAVLAGLAQRAAAAFPTADIEIVEIHHNQSRHENGKRTAQEIGVHSIRLGNEVGTHEILISTGNEVVTLKHEAKSRALFADGALAAAAWLLGKPAGLYGMQDMMV